MESKELLFAIRAILKEETQPINDCLDKIDSRLAKVESRLDAMDIQLDATGLRLDALELQIDSMGLRLDAMKESLEIVRSSQLRTELEYYPETKAAIDGISSVFSKNREQDNKLTVLEAVQVKHDARITKLEYAANH